MGLENEIANQEFKYGKVYMAWIESTQKNILCVGFNISENNKREYIFIVRISSDKSKVFAKGVIPRKDLTYSSLNTKYLTNAEKEYANKLLKNAGL